MLVLTRSIGERLVIGKEEVLIQILEVRGNQVRIGIEAPRHISVHREEIHRRIAHAMASSLEKKVEAEETV